MQKWSEKTKIMLECDFPMFLEVGGWGKIYARGQEL